MLNNCTLHSIVAGLSSEIPYMKVIDKNTACNTLNLFKTRIPAFKMGIFYNKNTHHN